MFTSAEIIFYDDNNNSSSLTLTTSQIYAIRKFLGLDYDYTEKCFLCYDDESVEKLTKALFRNWAKRELKD